MKKPTSVNVAETVIIYVIAAFFILVVMAIAYSGLHGQ
jgi:hypothetical protein